MSVFLLLAASTPLAALIERPRACTYRKRRNHIKGAHSYHPARARTPHPKGVK